MAATVEDKRQEMTDEQWTNLCLRAIWAVHEWKGLHHYEEVLIWNCDKLFLWFRFRGWFNINTLKQLMQDCGGAYFEMEPTSSGWINLYFDRDCNDSRRIVVEAPSLDEKATAYLKRKAEWSREVARKRQKKNRKSQDMAARPFAI